MQLVFIHGWGFDPTLWTPLRAALGDPDGVTLDLGYFGASPSPPPPAPMRVVVAHSFGLLWFLHHRPFAADSLISINGFPRFTGAPGFAQGVPRRAVERMLQSFADSPEGVLSQFRARCGDPAALPGPPDAARLHQDLVALRDWDARPALAELAGRSLVLAGRADPIVPAGLTEAGFAEVPRDRVAWHDDPGHLLPLGDPDWCAARISAFLAHPR